MSNENDNDQPKRVKVVIDPSTQEKLDAAKEELTKVKEQLEFEQAEKAQFALEQFEKDKIALLELVEDQDQKQYIRDHVTTIQTLEFVKNLSGKIIKAAVPAGKARLDDPNAPAAPQNELDNKNNEKIEYINQLYKTYNQSSDINEKKKADVAINKLWKNLLSNPSWNKLRDQAKTKSTSGKSIYDVAVSACPKCNSPNESPHGQTKQTITCINCGFKYAV